MRAKVTSTALFWREYKQSSSAMHLIFLGCLGSGGLVLFANAWRVPSEYEVVAVGICYARRITVIKK